MFLVYCSFESLALRKYGEVSLGTTTLFPITTLTVCHARGEIVTITELQVLNNMKIRLNLQSLMNCHWLRLDHSRERFEASKRERSMQ